MVKSFTISSVISCMSLVFVGFVFLSFAFLASPVALADNTISDSVIDKINIDVPVSCSLDGVGMYTYNAEIYNGTYEDDIGTTVLSNWAMKLAITQDSGDITGANAFALGYDYSQDYTSTYPGTGSHHKAGGAVTRCLQDYTGR